MLASYIVAIVVVLASCISWPNVFRGLDSRTGLVGINWNEFAACDFYT